MLNTRYPLEKILQLWRFKKVLPWIGDSDILDVGGNNGELGKFVKGEYFVVEKFNMTEIRMDRKYIAVMCAVLEHLEYPNKYFNVFRVFGIKKIVITTPTLKAHKILTVLSKLRLLDRENIKEHKEYYDWDKVKSMGRLNGYRTVYYEKFMLGFNQLFILERMV